MPKKSAQKTPQRNDTVTKSTFYGGIMVALSIGFLIGVVFSAFKGAGPVNTTPMTSSPMGSPMASQQGQSTDISESHKQQIAAAEKEVLTNPNDAAAWKRLGNGYFDSRQFQKAIDAYTKSLSIDDTNADVWTDMGVMYRRSGSPQKAIESFEKAMAADPKHEVSRFNKGIVLMHDMENPEGAIKAWEALLKINPLATAPNGKPLKTLIDQLKKTTPQ